MAEAGGWTAIRRRLRTQPGPELIELLHELFKLSRQNQAFLATRFARIDTENLIEPYRRRVEEQFRFRTSTMTVKLDLAEARRAIREYRKATDDAFGTAELMLTYVEAGTHYVTNYAEGEERVYNSLDSVLHKLVDLLLTGEGRQMYPMFRDRLKRVGEQAAQCGYGYCDSVGHELSRLEHLACMSSRTSRRRNPLPRRPIDRA